MNLKKWNIIFRFIILFFDGFLLAAIFQSCEYAEDPGLAASKVHLEQVWTMTGS